MNIQSYKFLNNTDMYEEFLEKISLLKINEMNLSYISLGIKKYDTNSGILLTSSDEWKNLVDKNQYYNTDPIFRAASLTKKKYVFYSRFNYSSEFEKNIFINRKNLELTKGLIKIEHFNNFRITYTFSTNYSKFNEIDFIKNNHKKIISFQEGINFFIKKNLLLNFES